MCQRHVKTEVSGLPQPMSHPHLPAELLDYTVDHLHDARDALKSCCLVSRSWVPRTRRHLFADVRFRTEKDLQSWKNTFPDPSTSPAHYTKYLLVHCPEAVTAADAEERGWIPAFSRTARFDVNISDDALSLVPFHGFSPAVKSLSVFYVDYPFSRILSLIRSFPHIEDLSLGSSDDDPIESDDSSDGQQTTVQPPFTGTLGLRFQGDTSLVVSRLLPLPSGYRFRKLDLLLGCEEDVLFASVLVERCRLTLESIRVNIGPYGTSARHPYLYQLLIPICRHTAATFNRPFDCARTQGRGISVLQRYPVGVHDSSNSHV